MKPLHCWAIFADGEMVLGSIARSRKAAIHAWVSPFGLIPDEHVPNTWRACRRRGYTCEQVTITKG